MGRTSQARDDLFLEVFWDASSSAICHQGEKDTAQIVKTDVRQGLNKQLELKKKRRIPSECRCHRALWILTAVT